MSFLKKDFDEFLKNRDKLISKYTDGELTKQQFLKSNYNYMKKIKIKPFFTIDSYEKGIFNYQYYNSIAKYYKAMASSINGRNQRKKYFIEKMETYYQKKDFSIIKLLEFLKYRNVEAYYIKINSKFLDNKLYEIVLKDYEYAILHSKSNWLLSDLKKAGVFLNEKKNSVIDEYINEKYWNSESL